MVRVFVLMALLTLTFQWSNGQMNITAHHAGDEQTTVNGREWCEQRTGYCEDDYYGHYYWETEYPEKYLHMEFWV